MSRAPFRAASLPAAVTAACLALALASCGGDEADSRETTAPAEVTVTVTRPVVRELPRFVRVTGTLFGDEEATIAAKVSGRIVEVVKDLGDTAAPGEALIRVDPIDYDLAKTERERAFVEALAKLGLDALPEGEFDVDALPSVERSRLQAENAKARYERARVLATRKPPLISEQDFADIETAWEVARSNMKVERLTAEATLAEARTLYAQVQIAEQRVLDTVHRAPEHPAVDTAGSMTAGRSGRLYEVAERLVTVGDYVQIGAPLLRLVDADPLKLRASVPERRLGTVERGQRVGVRVEAFDRTFDGVISRVSPAVDTRTRAFPIEILVRNPELELKPGSFAAADIEVGREKALTVPPSAIVTFAGVHKVVLVRDGKAEERRVELGDRHEGFVEVREGVAADDVLVAEPTGAITNGTPLAIASSPASPSTEQARR